MAQVIVIKKGNRPLYVGLVGEMKQTEYLALVKECERTQKDEDYKIKRLEEKLDKAEKQIKKLEHEIAVDRGEAE